MQKRSRIRAGAWRSRWAAVGAAVAVTLGAGGMVAVNAASSDPSSFVSIDPTRILDTRTDVGLAGPFVSGVAQKLQVTGTVPTQPPGGVPAENVEVVPATATAVILNATVVKPSTKGFLSIRPGDATGTPATSNINWAAGGANIANSITVQLPASGQIDIFVNGTVGEVLIDVAGYYIPAAAGPPGPQGDPGPKGDQGDPGPTGPVTMSQGPSEFTVDIGNGATSLTYVYPRAQVSADGVVGIGLVGPTETGGDSQTLTSVTYCISNLTGGGVVNVAEIDGHAPNALNSDTTIRTATGCYTVIPSAQVQAGQTFELLLLLSGGGSVGLQGVTTTWAAPTVPVPSNAVEEAPILTSISAE